MICGLDFLWRSQVEAYVVEEKKRAVRSGFTLVWKSLLLGVLDKFGQVMLGRRSHRADAIVGVALQLRDRASFERPGMKWQTSCGYSHELPLVHQSQ